MKDSFANPPDPISLDPLGIAKPGDRGSAPLSFAQERLWFLDRWNPGEAVYNIPIVLRMAGELNVAALQQSLEEILRRHEALRTTFAEENGRALQRLTPETRLELEFISLENLPEKGRRAEAQRRIVEESRRPFDLSRGPLFRGTLLRLGAREHVLVLAMHHIVTDGWSLGVLYREFAALYEAFLRGDGSPLPPLPIQYADYALWQRQWLQGEVLEKQLTYWKGQLEGLPVLELPTDRPRPPMQSYRGKRRSFTLPAPLVQSLRELSRREGVTLFMTLLAAFQTLLCRYSGQEDIAVGSPIANRNREELEGLIGFFVNTLVMRTKLDGNPTFRELLGRVKEVALGAYAHQEVPFEKLVEELKPERDTSRNPLFQVMLVLQNAMDQDLKLSGLDVHRSYGDIGTAMFDLMLEVEESPEGLATIYEYNTDLYDDATIERMSGHFQVMLEGIVAAPGTRISDLPLLSEAERRQLLVEWNDTRTGYPRDACVHELFEVQAGRTPDAVALAFNGRELSYGELNARANQLAHYLRKRGVGREALVGICLERSLEMVIGLVAILKAGGAYVPLDAEYPRERLDFMVRDTGIRHLLTQQRLAGNFSSIPEIVCLDRDWDLVSAESELNPESRAGAGNLAYVMYTSGSTGTPKGVEIPHKGIVRLVMNADYARFGRDETYLQLATVSFDASTFEIWAPLLHGAKCVIYPAELPTTERLGEVIRESGVTTLWLTASLFNAVVNETPETLKGIRQLLIGGEQLSTPHVRKAQQGLSGTQIINGYGPTESTTFTCTYAIPDGIASDEPLPIGRPIANTCVYILDPNMQPVPVGIPGELYIGGDGLARGYLSRPKLTAERFVSDPFNTDPGARLYKTGDLVRYRPDGNIEYLGRMDFQVKIRGYRIELGEIEAVLGQYPGIGETAVVLREDTPGDRILVAYVVPREKGKEQIPASELRRYLQEKLPDYMVPSAFVTLEAMQRTSSGKVDRKALPAPERLHPELEKGYVAPRTEAEERLASIWKEVLNLEKVGVYDNFFDLGGHSLKATQVMSQLRRIVNVDLPLKLLFESPTISGLAEHIQSAPSGAPGIDFPELSTVSDKTNLPLSFAQQRLWFLDRLNPGGAVYNIPIVMRMKGRLDVEALRRSLEEILRRHEALRTTFAEENGHAIQRIAPEASLDLKIVDLGNLPERERQEAAERRIAEESRRSFDLARGPLFRGTVLHLSGQEHALVLAMHHIVTDGWSHGILFRELETLYEAFLTGKSSPLAPLPIQYADFAVWQREWLQGEVLQTDLGYWKGQLEGLPVLELPTDRPRPPVQSFRGRRKSFVLSPSLTQVLKDLSRREGVTLFMALLAAFQTQLYRYSGQGDIAVGSPIANRRRDELEGLIGFFVNTLVMRTKLDGNPTFRELLGRVKETALEAYAHQDVPFEKLVEELRPERDASRNPLFQVVMVLQNAADHRIALPGVDVECASGDTGTAMFDLTLELEEDAGGISGNFEYSTDLFDDGTIERMSGHFQVMLEGIVAAPGTRISDLPLLSEAERRQLLVEWNDTRTGYPRDACVHELFEVQAGRTPDAVALAFNGRELSYGELNARANQLAHYLRKRGVGREALVGICLERSLEMVIGLVAILKAGGAYVPLDAEYPRERLDFMVRDTGIRHLLTQQRLAGNFSSIPEIVCLDRDWDLVSAESELNPESRAGAGNLAYVMYTSGSTGTPKGVEIPHKGIVRLVMNADYARFGRDETYLQLATVSFDASTFEIWAPLLHGAKCVIYPAELPTTERLGEVIRESGVTTLWLTASLFNAVVNETPETLKGIRQLLIGGEQLSTPHVRKAQQGLSGTQIINGYGPTESTTFTCTYAIPDGIASDEPLPIGRPIANTCVYILDPNMQPVPVGIPGELYIGGDGLARGYLSRPKLTAERFVSDPFNTDPGARLYKTGDLVRYRPDGNIEYLGRMDFQVKIRGYRIELGEIEAVLGQYPGIGETAVVLREDTPGDRILVAYVVPREKGKEQIPASELRRYLQEKLPDYMVPSAFVTLEAMQRTSSGKVDRKALPVPERVPPGLKGMHSAPRTPMEEILAGIWSETLGLERIGIHDNFFELGGHSLKATRLISRVRKVFEADIPLRCLFNSPTVAGLAEHIQSALGREMPAPAPALAGMAGEGSLTLSYGQERLWFLDRWDPGNTVYNVPIIIRIRGGLDYRVLQLSLEEILRRHEALRTTFSEENGRVVRCVTPEAQFELESVNLEHLPEEERQAKAEAGIEDASRRSFDLARGPLFRGKLLRLGTREHVLVLAMHHIVTDGWSLGVLYRELGALYGAFLKGDGSPLPPLPVQYGDYAVWQRQWLQGEVLEKQLTYWKGKLEGLPVLELPTDRPRPPIQSYRGKRRSFTLQSPLVSSLRDLSRREGVTLFMTLLATFQALLSRYSGQEDIAIGSPIANRSRMELEGLIGFFVNTLVMRTKLDGNPSFRELLGRVKETTLGAYAHQDVPFEKLVKEMNPERDASRNPLFQVMMVLQNANDRNLELPGLSIENSAGDAGTSRVDLTLELEETSDHIAGRIEYSTDLFDDATIGRMIGHFERLLEGVVANPDELISGLPLLTDAERHQLLVEWNDTKTDYPRDACVHELFEAQVERTPDAVALVFEGRKLTYRELNARANQLAHYLRKRGVGPETLVGICMQRSLELVVAIYGTMKAGAAYVPIDPEYPVERLTFILEDAHTPIILTQEAHRGKLQSASVQFVCLDSGWSKIESESRDNLRSNVSSDSAIYVIYTSGSTGRPKGVVNLHRGVVNWLFWLQDAYRLSCSDAIMQKSPFTFDVSVREFFWPLLNGARLIVAKPDGHWDSEYLIESIGREHVTVMHFVPSMLRTFLKELPGEIPLSLARVICSGEALPLDLQNEFLRRLPDVALSNLYGPTEAAVEVTNWECRLEADRREVPIGRPIANIRMYILDKALNPVPIGVPGELHIGGAGVARGYLNRPELTAERFIPDPFNPKLGARLYKTGDLARYGTDGNIEYLGRMDYQVKLRGFRIELGEIETVLAQHPGILEAAVVMREDTPGDKTLVAYVVPKVKREVEIPASELRRYLQQKLPQYMVPGIFVPLETMQHTSSGKMDRRALPKPQNLVAGVSGPIAAPRTLIEKSLSAIWAEVLGLQDVGIHDSFFELGGHSLKATWLISLVRRKFQVDIPLRLVFNSPTVAGLAEYIQAAIGQAHRVRAGSGSSIIQIQDAGDTVPLFVMHGLGGDLNFAHRLAPHLAPTQSVYGLHNATEANTCENDCRLEDLAERYVEDLVEFLPEGPYCLTGFSFGGILAYELARQLAIRGLRIGHLAIVDTGPSLPTDTSPAGILTYIAGFLTNAPWWVWDDLLSNSAGYHLRRIWRKAFWFERRLRHLFRPDSMEITVEDLEDVIDLRTLPEDILQKLEFHLRLFQNYQPHPYDGPITLYRARSQPLLCLSKPDLGWAQFAARKVDIIRIPGTHKSITDKDNIRFFANSLQSRLAEFAKHGCSI